MKPRFYVYEHWRPDKDVCFYVGKGKGWRRNEMRSRNSHHVRIQKKLSRLGMCVEVRMVAMLLFEDEAFALEKERIAFWKNSGVDLANKTEGGEGVSGFVPSEEYRAAVSARFKGRRHTEETKKKMSAARTGKTLTEKEIAWLKELHARTRGSKRSEELKKHQSMIMTGRKHTPEARARMSVAMKGKKKSPEHIEKLRASRIRNHLKKTMQK